MLLCPEHIQTSPNSTLSSVIEQPSEVATTVKGPPSNGPNSACHTARFSSPIKCYFLNEIHFQENNALFFPILQNRQRLHTENIP